MTGQLFALTHAHVSETMASYISIESLLNIESGRIIIFSFKNSENILRRKTRDLFSGPLPRGRVGGGGVHGVHSHPPQAPKVHILVLKRSNI